MPNANELSAEAGPPVVEQEGFRPAEYLRELRRLMQSQEVAAKGFMTPKIGALMYFEEEKSRAFLERELESGTLTQQQFDWLHERFIEVTGRIVKVTERASERGHGIVPYAEIPEEQQAAIREQLLDDWLELADILAAADKEPSKTVFDQCPVLYLDPDTARQLQEANRDLGKGTVGRTIMSYPSRAAEVLQEVREKIAVAVEKYPALPPNEVRRIVATSKDSYEEAIKRFAESTGYSLEGASEELPNARSFFESIRSLYRARKYDTTTSGSVPHAFRQSKFLGAEAGEWLDTMGNSGTEGYDLIRSGFMRKVGSLALLSDKAWRHGDLAAPLSSAPPEYRHEVYAVAFEEFMTVHAALNETITKHSTHENPFLLTDADTIRVTVEANPDIPISYLTRLIVKHPRDPQEGVRMFRDKVSELMAADPRLLEHEAKRIALERPRQTPETVEVPPLPDIAGFLDLVRAYLRSDGARLGMVLANNIKFELEDRQEEINAFVAEADVPAEARPALRQRIRESFIASGRGWRKGELPGWLAHYEPEQRREFYGHLVAELTAAAAILSPRSEREWDEVPILYHSSGRLKELREEYAELSDAQFTRVSGQSKKYLPERLAENRERKHEFIRLYPSASTRLVESTLLSAPQRADEKILEHLQRTTDREFRRSDSRIEYPDPRRVEQYLRSLRTRLRNQDALLGTELDPEEERAGRPLADRAAGWCVENADSLGINKRDDEYISRFASFVNWYVEASVRLNKADASFPSMLDLSEAGQMEMIRLLHQNQGDLQEKIADLSPRSKPKIRKFGMYHPARYLDSLFRSFGGYFSEQLIAYVALASPRRPNRPLCALAVKRAALMRKNPGWSGEQVEQELLKSIRPGAGNR